MNPALSTDNLKAGQDLYNWLGDFWRRVYKDPQFAKGLMDGFGLQAAQYYLDFLERINLLNRNHIPALHRERWRMVTLLRSQVGTGEAVRLKVGKDPMPVVGPQSGTAYERGKVFVVGGYGIYENAVSYPMPGIESVITCVTSNVINPGTVLVSGNDFVVEDGTIIFTNGVDPFNDPNFAKVTLHGDTEDTAISIWCCDALYDKDYVYRFLSYVVGLRMESSEYAIGAVNALWDFYNNGASRLSLCKALGAILDEPVFTEDTTITRIIESTAEQSYIVETTSGVYTTPITSTLNPKIVPGAVLNAGEFLTDHVRMYGSVDPMRLAVTSPYGMRFVTDVSALQIDKTLLAAALERGIGIDWNSVPIVSEGTTELGISKLKFELYGSESDKTKFWEYFWNYCAEKGITSEACFSDYLNGIMSDVEGTVRGYVKPMEFFLRYFLKYNALFVVVDRSRLSETGRRSSALLSLIQRGLPAHTMLIMTERLTAGSEPYTLDELNETVSPTLVSVSNETARVGTVPTSTGLVYLDRKPVLRWVPECA